VLAMYQPRNNAPLDEVARLAGFPGKLGMEGAAVWSRFQAGEIQGIRDYCEADAANTYLLFLRFQQLRGVFSDEQTRREFGLLRACVEKLRGAHWAEFLERWNQA